MRLYLQNLYQNKNQNLKIITNTALINEIVHWVFENFVQFFVFGMCCLVAFKNILRTCKEQVHFPRKSNEERGKCRSGVHWFANRRVRVLSTTRIVKSSALFKNF